MKTARHGAWTAMRAIGLALTLAACGQPTGSEKPPEPGDPISDTL